MYKQYYIGRVCFCIMIYRISGLNYTPGKVYLCPTCVGAVVVTVTHLRVRLSLRIYHIVYNTSTYGDITSLQVPWYYLQVYMFSGCCFSTYNMDGNYSSRKGVIHVYIYIYIYFLIYHTTHMSVTPYHVCPTTHTCVMITVLCRCEVYPAKRIPVFK